MKLFNLIISITLLLAAFVADIDSLKIFGPQWSFGVLKKSVTAAIAGAVLISGSPVQVAADDSPASTLQAQLQAMQLRQTGEQKLALDTADQALLTKILSYPEGRLVARGTVTVAGDKQNQLTPYGMQSAADLDPSYGKDTATLFVLCVGKEGPPLAAKRIPLKDVSFPYVFEVTSEDLLFPYNEEAWLKSSNIKDTVALTTILSQNARLSQPEGTQWFGFGVSDPQVFAGKLIRSSGAISVNDRINMGLYTPEELQILATVDNELDRISGVSLPSAAAKTNNREK